MMLEAADLMHDPLVTSFIEQGNRHLEAIGYTDHGQVHVKLVSRLCREILLKLGYPERMAELAAIAGYLHDIGNVINRNGHSQAGALIAWELLNRMQMPEEETAVICSAIGNHDEGNGHPVNPVTAALILADKSHVHRNRVRNHDVATFDIHDRVNYTSNTPSSILMKRKSSYPWRSLLTPTYARLWIFRDFHEPHADVPSGC